jgi:hypothetical protein
MPTVQSTYGTMSAARAGMIANMEEVGNDISRTVEDSAGIGFGKLVFQGTDDRGITATPGTTVRGITVRSQARDANNPDKYGQYESAKVRTKGPIWVTVSGAVTAGAAVYYTAAGLFTATASGNTALTGAIFDTSAADGGLAIIRLG